MRIWQLVMLTAAAVAWAAPARADIQVAESQPLEGVPVEITVTDGMGNPAPGASVTALFRPGSEVSSQGEAGVTDAGGKLLWTPPEAGLVTLTAETREASESFSTTIPIRYSGAPGSGLIVMLAAGIILYGGVIFGFRKLSQPIPDFPPDT